MVHGKNRIPYRIDRRLTGLAGPDYDATISFGLPFESEDSQYGKYRLNTLVLHDFFDSWSRLGGTLSLPLSAQYNSANSSSSNSCPRTEASRP